MLRKPVLVGLIVITTIITLVEVLYLSFNDLYYDLTSSKFKPDPEKTQLWWNKIFNDVIYNNTRGYVNNEVDLPTTAQNVIKKLPKWIPKTLYKEKSKGIVIFGDVWTSYLNILQLRHMGSKLPIELMILEPHDELCNEITKFNTRCVKIELNDEIRNNWEINNDIYKSLAISMSSFHHLIYLNANSFLLKVPDSIFKSPVYLKNTFITWSSIENKDSINTTYSALLGKQPSLKSLISYSKFPFKTKVDSTKDLKFYLMMDEKFGINLSSDQMVINKEKNGKNLYVAMFLKLFDFGVNNNNVYGISNLLTNKKTYQVKAIPRKNEAGEVFKDPTIDFTLYSENNNLDGDLRDINTLIKVVNSNDKNYILRLDRSLDPFDLMNGPIKLDVEFEKYNTNEKFQKFHYNNIHHIFCQTELYKMFPSFQNKEVGEVCSFIDSNR